MSPAWPGIGDPSGQDEGESLLQGRDGVTVDISEALETITGLAKRIGGGLSSAWAGPAVSNEIAAVFRDIFGGQNKWQPLAATTMMARARRMGYYKQPPASSGVGTLVWTGRLRDSLGNPRGTGGDSFIRFSPTRLEQGTTVEYAAKHHRGIGVPRRSLTDLTGQHQQRILNAFTAFILPPGT